MAEVLVVNVPGQQGPPGVSAVNNIVNPILNEDVFFTDKTEIIPLGYAAPPSVSLTFDTTLLIKGLLSNHAVVTIEGPTGSTTFAAMQLPYKAMPAADGNSVSFDIANDPDSGGVLVKLSGSITTTEIGGGVSVSLENLGEDEAYIAASSFVQWSIPVVGIISGGIASTVNNINVRLATLEADVAALKAGG